KSCACVRSLVRAWLCLASNDANVRRQLGRELGGSSRGALRKGQKKSAAAWAVGQALSSIHSLQNGRIPLGGCVPRFSSAIPGSASIAFRACGTCWFQY